MKDLNEEMKGKKRLIDWRRNQIIEYSSKGITNHADIARILHISEPTVSRDFVYLREQAKKNIRDYTENVLPLTFSETISGINGLLRNAWVMIGQSEGDNKEKLQAMSLVMECYSMRIDLLSHTETINSAIKFIKDYREKQEQNNKNKKNKNKNVKSNNISDNNNNNINDIEQEERQSQEQEEERQQEEVIPEDEGATVF